MSSCWSPEQTGSTSLTNLLQVILQTCTFLNPYGENAKAAVVPHLKSLQVSLFSLQIPMLMPFFLAISALPPGGAAVIE